MNDLSDLSTQLYGLLQRQAGAVAPDAVACGALRCRLDGARWVGLHFQAQQQRWLLGVGCATGMCQDAPRARLEEALLRVGHDSRWGLQQTGLGDDYGVELVDCDFPAVPAQLTAAAVQGQLQALLAQLDALEAGRPWVPDGWLPRSGRQARACGCAQAFGTRMQALDASRPTGGIAPQELLLEGQLPVRISLHPRSHHWVFEAFVGDCAAQSGPLRRGLVSALLHINGAVLNGRPLVCSLDGSDRVVVISRWHLDWAAHTALAAWLDYSARQARRIRGAAAAIAMRGDAPPDRDVGSWP